MTAVEQLENIINANKIKLNTIDKKMTQIENINQLNDEESAEIVGELLTGTSYNELDEEFDEIYDETTSLEDILQTMKQRDFTHLDSTQGAFLSMMIQNGRITL